MYCGYPSFISLGTTQLTCNSAHIHIHVGPLPIKHKDYQAHYINVGSHIRIVNMFEDFSLLFFLAPLQCFTGKQL